MENDTLNVKVDKLEKNVDVLTKDVGILKTDVAVLKTDVKGIQKRVDNIEISQNKMAFAIVNLQEDMTQVKETMATKNDIHQIQDTLDELVKLARKRDEENTFMSYRIQEHDKDIKKLKVADGIT